MIYLLIFYSLIGTWFGYKYFQTRKVFYTLSHYAYISGQAEATISYCKLYDINVRNKDIESIPKKDADANLLQLRENAEALLLQYKEAYPASDKMFKLFLKKENHGQVPASR